MLQSPIVYHTLCRYNNSVILKHNTRSIKSTTRAMPLDPVRSKIYSDRTALVYCWTDHTSFCSLSDSTTQLYKYAYMYMFPLLVQQVAMAQRSDTF